MKELLNKFLPQDIIALVTIAGGLILIFSGLNGVTGTLLTTIVLFYFGKREVYDVIKTKMPIHSKIETVGQIIERIARDEGIDQNLAVRVARCESGLNPMAKNTNSNGSIDRGLYQWNDRWHPEITDQIAFDIEKSCRAFCKAFKDGHLSWWNATRSCWDI